MNMQPGGGTMNSVGYQPSFGNSPFRGVNKKKFFKNNLHHNSNVVLFGSGLVQLQEQIRSGTRSKPDEQMVDQAAAHFADNRDYWQNYRRDYEQRMLSKLHDGPAGPASGTTLQDEQP